MNPPQILLEHKLKSTVFLDEERGYAIIRMPADKDFLHREGIDMKHCLGFEVIAEEYTERLKEGSQEQYSLISTEDGHPFVDIEVSISESSYSGPVDKKVVTQIRGYANQCPPADEYIPTIWSFLKAHPEWIVCGHMVNNFDGNVDGDKFMARVHTLGIVEDRIEE